MFIFLSMPLWAVALCGVLLLVTILAPIHIMREMMSLISLMESTDTSGKRCEPGEVKPLKGIVAGFFLHQALAVFCLIALAIAVSLGKALPLLFGIAVAALCANALRLRSRVSVSERVVS